MEVLVGRVFAGHLRSIIGGLTVEQIIRERDRVAQEVKDGSHGEMEKLGIVVDALEIQEIEDRSGYIDNLAAPHAAAVASQARIARARADQRAAEQEQQAAAMKAQHQRDLLIKQSGFLAETEQAKARAAQAGPLAEARASQEVIEQQTALAQRHADLAARRLEAEVRRPADAEAYKQRILAKLSATTPSSRPRGTPTAPLPWPRRRPRRRKSRRTRPPTPRAAWPRPRPTPISRGPAHSPTATRNSSPPTG